MTWIHFEHIDLHILSYIHTYICLRGLRLLRFFPICFDTTHILFDSGICQYSSQLNAVLAPLVYIKSPPLTSTSLTYLNWAIYFGTTMLIRVETHFHYNYNDVNSSLSFSIFCQNKIKRMLQWG